MASLDSLPPGARDRKTPRLGIPAGLFFVRDRVRFLEVNKANMLR